MDALQGRPQDSHAVDITSLARQLRQELATADSSSQQQSGGGPIIIAEVGKLTRNVDPDEYDPHHVAIGPYHRTKNPDLARDEEKITSLGTVLSMRSSADTTLDLCLDDLARLEVKARSCYAHPFEMDSETFVRMLLLDSCYLLVKFGGVANGRRTNGAAASNSHVDGGDQLADLPSVSAAPGSDKMEAVAVVRDVLYLAENQIPLFVIQKIHELTSLDGGISAEDTFARKYVGDLLRRQQYSVTTPQTPQLSGAGNLLHLLHMHFKPSALLSTTSGDGEVTGDRVDRWRTATEYYFAGVKFKKRPLCHDGDGAECILDVKLNTGSGVLEIPHLSIDAETWRLLRNLMALEQRNPETTESHVTAYCVFMSQISCTPTDVELLSRSGVITHGLGNNAEVADCFANLCKGIIFSVNDHKCNYLRGTCLILDKKFRSRHGRWMAWLQQKYFRNPWLAVGLAAAVVGLVCTVVQAVFSVLSYKQGAK